MLSARRFCRAPRIPVAWFVEFLAEPEPGYTTGEACPVTGLYMSGQQR